MKKYLATAINTSANNLKYKRLDANTIEEATQKMEAWCNEVIERHPLVRFEDKKVVEITDDMEVVRFTKTNGYRLSEEFNANIEEWETALKNKLGNEVMIIEHFYYGDTLDMAGVILKDGNYMNFNINEKHVSCTGHTCTFEQLAKFESLQK